jgi:hypothetical protein
MRISVIAVVWGRVGSVFHRDLYKRLHTPRNKVRHRNDKHQKLLS